jgi:hypothetical protein
VPDQEETANETVPVAHATVHLNDGENFELLPFMDTKDVKSKVTDLLGDWSKSGFLVRGGQIIPWHRVQWVEVTRVDELSPADADRRLADWTSRDQEKFQQAFWKTKEAREKKDEDEGKSQGHGGAGKSM